jgi:hypothetical protein
MEDSMESYSMLIVNYGGVVGGNLGVSYNNEGKNNNYFALNTVKKRKDRVSLEEFEEKLKEWRVEYSVKNSNHVKVKLVNFYLSTGTCYIDGMGASFKNKGIRFFEEVLRKEGLL